MVAKRVMSVVLICMMVFSVTIMPVSAKDFSQHEQEADFGASDGLIMQPRYIASCPVANKHQMQGRGICWVYSGSASSPGTLEIYGFANQCKNCNLVLASEGNPRVSGVLGKYRLEGKSGNIGSVGVVIYGGITGTFYGSLNSDSYWQGFEFI